MTHHVESTTTYKDGFGFFSFQFRTYGYRRPVCMGSV